MNHPFPEPLGPSLAPLLGQKSGPDELRPRLDLEPPGSPERCAARWVVEDSSGAPWLVERLRPGQAPHRRILGRVLHGLSRAGLDEVVAYEPLGDHDFILDRAGCQYQISRFVPHTPLPRPEFLDHEERGRSLAEFLAALRNASAGQPTTQARLLPGLRLPEYARNLLATVRARRPDAAARLGPVLDALAPLFEAWDDLPQALCHGDFHPLNVLWQEREVLAVIDWEFCGRKPELYDTANMVGCCGFEHPRAFASGLVPALLKELRRCGLLTADNASWLPLLVPGLRLAWLSEWLRKKDEDMVTQELDYLDLLVSSLPDMARAWRV